MSGINIDTGQSSGSYSHRQNGSEGYSHAHRYPSQTHGQDAYPTPITGSSISYHQSSPQAGPSRRQGSAIQRDIDVMEHQARGMSINEPTDGRVGTENPSESHPYLIVAKTDHGLFRTTPLSVSSLDHFNSQAPNENTLKSKNWVMGLSEQYGCVTGTRLYVQNTCSRPCSAGPDPGQSGLGNG
jgi:hypothetical protein